MTPALPEPRPRASAVTLLAVLLAGVGGCADNAGLARPTPPPASPTPTAAPTLSPTATLTPEPAATPTATEGPAPLHFGRPGPLVGPQGRGSFRFGAATAATQIEDGNVHTDWYLWTAPPPAGMGRGTFVGDAVQGYSRALDDVRLLEETHLDAYRFSVEWARVEPERDRIDAAALDHYDALLDRLVAAGIRPMITIHHFSHPVWVDDPRIDRCPPEGPTDANLCGWSHPDGAAQIVGELAEHARLLAERYGDRVDEWATINEPFNYIAASYGVGQFPPGRQFLIRDIDALIAVFRNFLRAHAAVYDAIRDADRIDADGDGVAAAVGLTLNTIEWAPARNNRPSDHPDDVAAAERMRYAYHHFIPDSIRNGTFDANLDGEPEERHPEWKGRLDWLGVQYYSRQGVTAEPAVIGILGLTVCFGNFDFGACLPPADPTHWVPAMRYEYYEPGLYNVLTDFAGRWPDLPLVVTESGLATRNGVRRAEHIVRSLEQIARAQAEGADVRGYYHWSLMDNFEWAEGFEPKFGLYGVDLETYERTPTEGAALLAEIAAARTVTGSMRERYGGLGPMSPEQPPASP